MTLFNQWVHFTHMVCVHFSPKDVRVTANKCKVFLSDHLSPKPLSNISILTGVITHRMKIHPSIGHKGSLYGLIDADDNDVNH